MSWRSTCRLWWQIPERDREAVRRVNERVMNRERLRAWRRKWEKVKG